MAAGAPWHWNAAVWVMEATNDSALHDEPAKQGKGLLVMHVWAARHAGLGQHEHDVSHGMGQEGEVGWQVERGDRTCATSRGDPGKDQRHPQPGVQRKQPLERRRSSRGFRRLDAGGGSQLTLFFVDKSLYNPPTNPSLIRH